MFLAGYLELAVLFIAIGMQVDVACATLGLGVQARYLRTCSLSPFCMGIAGFCKAKPGRVAVAGIPVDGWL